MWRKIRIKKCDGCRKLEKRYLVRKLLTTGTQRGKLVEVDLDFIRKAEDVINDPSVEYEELKSAVKGLGHDTESQTKWLAGILSRTTKKTIICIKTVIVKRIPFCKNVSLTNEKSFTSI